MRFCPNCGQQLADDVVFCGNCGARLPMLETSQPAVSEPPEVLAAPEVPTPPAAPEAPEIPEPPVIPEPPEIPTPPEAPEPPETFAPPAAPEPPVVPTPPVAPVPPVPPTPPKSSGFCPHCGAPQPAGTTFCANCGASLTRAPQPQTQAAPPKKGGGAKKAIIAVVVVALVAALGVAAYFLLPRFLPGSVANPFAPDEEQFADYQQSALTDRLLAGVETAVDSYSGGLSTDLTISASVKGNDEIQKILKDSEIRLSLDVGSGEGSFLASAELVLMGSPVLSGMVTYDDGTAGFYLPELDKNYYTADLSKLLKNLSGEEISFDGISMPDISVKEWSKLLQDYLDVVFSVVNKDNLTVEKKTSFRLSQLKGSYEGTVYTVTPTAKDIEGMLLDLADHLAKDKQLRKLLLEAFSSNSIVTLLALGDDYGEIDIEEEIDDMLAELVDELEDNAADIAEELEDVDLTWTLCMEGKEVRMISITWKDDYKYTFAYEREGDESKGVKEVFYAMQDKNAAFFLENSYTKKDSTYTGKLAFTTDPDTEWEKTITFKYDADAGKRSALGIPYGSYELTYPTYQWEYNERTGSYNSWYEDVSIALEVTGAGKGSVDHIITIKDMEAVMGYDVGFDRLEITINATDKCTAKAPSGKKVDISNYDVEELADLFNDLENEAENSLGQAMYDLGIAVGGAASSGYN